MATENKRYLGDGVHAEWDGSAIRLKTRGRDDQEIVLEYETFLELVKFAGEIDKTS